MSGRLARSRGGNTEDRVTDPDIVALDAELFEERLTFGRLELVPGEVDPAGSEPLRMGGVQKIAHHEGGIDLISCPTANAALDSYGDVHGYGVITLDESDLSTYSYDTVSYASMYPDENVFTGFIKQLRGLFSSLMIIFEQLF